MSHVLLDGTFVDPTTIDPKLHRFIGMFRPAVNPFANPTCDILCVCGATLRYRGQEDEHYRKGCFDSPQYISIEKEISA